MLSSQSPPVTRRGTRCDEIGTTSNIDYATLVPQLQELSRQ